MALLQRFTTPFVALLPDLNNVPQQRQAVGAIMASLVFHLLLLLFFVAMAGLIPDVRVDFAKPEAELQPLELTVMDSPPPPPPEEKPAEASPAETAPSELLSAAELEMRALKPIINSAGLAKSEEAPKDAIFEADQNMKAASELPGTGDLPLPTQKGAKSKEEGSMFADQESVIAKARPAPTVGPQPVMVEEISAAQAPRATPVPAPEVLTPTEDQIAIAPKMTEVQDGPVTKLAPAFRTRPVPSPQDRPQLAKLATPPPQPASPSDDKGFQNRQWKTEVEGGITNRGKNSVDAEQSTRGLYARQVEAAFGSRWYFFMKKNPDRYLTGTATVRYAISRDGKVSDVRLVENTSNASFGLMCLQCVREAEIIPPPAEVLETMGSGEKFEDDFTFNYVPIR